MTGPNPAERGISQGPEIRLFKETPAEELSRRSGGMLEYFEGKPFMLHYNALNARIWFDSTHPADRAFDEKSISYLEIHNIDGKGTKLKLDNAAVILGENAITFVRPIERSLFVREESVLSWVTISEEEGITAHAAQAGMVRDPQILEATRIAQEGLDPKISRRIAG